MRKNLLTLLLALSLATLVFLSACSPSEPQSPDALAIGTLGYDATAATGNIFLDAAIDYKPITNSSKADVVGKRASISVAKDDALASRAEDFSEFASEIVDESGFNWWTIFFDDGTGIVFSGSSILAPEYGELASNGTVSKGYGALLLGEDGLYSYEEYED